MIRFGMANYPAQVLIVTLLALQPFILHAQMESKIKEIVKMTCFLDGEIIFYPDTSLTVLSLEAIDPKNLAQSVLIKPQIATKLFGKIGNHGVYLMYSKNEHACIAKNHAIVSRYCSDLQVDPFTSFRKIYPNDSIIDANNPGIDEKKPEFPGGISALQGFISSLLKYPEDARSNSILGRVIIGFIVKEDGTCSDIRAICGRNLGILTSEAIRIGNSLPRFFPGSRAGKPIKTFTSVSINFNLSAQENQLD